MIGDGLRQVRKGVTPFPHSKSHQNLRLQGVVAGGMSLRRWQRYNWVFSKVRFLA